MQFSIPERATVIEKGGRRKTVLECVRGKLVWSDEDFSVTDWPLWQSVLMEALCTFSKLLDIMVS